VLAATRPLVQIAAHFAPLGSPGPGVTPNQVKLSFHHRGADNSAGTLASIIDMADYLCVHANLGFFGEFPDPGREMLSACGCADEESLTPLVQELRDAFDQETLLFREA
jgi:hypothetical protein